MCTAGQVLHACRPLQIPVQFENKVVKIDPEILNIQNIRIWVHLLGYKHKVPIYCILGGDRGHHKLHCHVVEAKGQMGKDNPVKHFSLDNPDITSLKGSEIQVVFILVRKEDDMPIGVDNLGKVNQAEINNSLQAQNHNVVLVVDNFGVNYLSF